MSETLCIRCGSDLKRSSYCELCRQPLVFKCIACDYTTDEKVHSDCRNVELFSTKKIKDRFDIE